MRSMSIRWRLTTWYGAVLAATLTVFGGAVYLVMRHVLLAKTSAGMYMESVEVQEEIARTGSRSLLGSSLGRRFARHPGYDIQVGDPGGKPLFRSDRLQEVGLPVPSAYPEADRDAYEDFLRGRVGRSRLLSRIVPGPGGPVILQVAVPSEGDDRELGELLAALLLAGPLALASALGGGYFLARRALAPVDRMATEADQITALRLDRRLDVPHRTDELGRLAATLNGMIARLERSFVEVRRFTADAAHELRTPLAVIRNVAEVALRFVRDPDHYRRVLGDVLEEVERLTRLTEQMLFLCREDAGLIPPRDGEVPLDLLVRETVEHMGIVAGAKGLTVEVAAPSPCPIRGDADQLRRLLVNLLDNAIKYTPGGGAVRVELACEGRLARLAIADTGIGIPAEHLPHVFERFYRVDPARGQDTEGTGLGLAICRAIAEAHGGRVEIESTAGRGTRAILTLPARPEAVEAWRIGTAAVENGRPADFSDEDILP